MENSIIIREMTDEDIDIVCGIEKECFSLPWSRNAFEESLEKAYSYFYVAEQNGKVVGYAGMYNIADEADVTNVAVNPLYRRKGIADKLVKKVIEKTRELNSACVNLEVRQSNSNAIALYEKNGFISLGIRKNFYEKPLENAVIMRREL